MKCQVSPGLNLFQLITVKRLVSLIAFRVQLTEPLIFAVKGVVLRNRRADLFLLRAWGAGGC